jgi:hypothetical protein
VRTLSRSLFRPGIALVAAAAILFTACSPAPSPLIVALEAISVAADVGASVVAQLDPQAALWVNLIPGAVTAALDAADGQTPLASATSAISQLQNVWTEGSAILPGLSGSNKTLISGILNALGSGLALFQRQYGTPSVTGSLALRGYALGFLDSPSAKAARVKKLNRKDKALIASARAHVAALQAKLAAARK